MEKHKGRNWLENSVASNSQQPQVNTTLDGVILYETDSIRNASKVTDPATGEPQVVYHGSQNIFDEFKMVMSESGGRLRHS